MFLVDSDIPKELRISEYFNYFIVSKSGLALEKNSFFYIYTMKD